MGSPLREYRLARTTRAGPLRARRYKRLVCLACYLRQPKYRPFILPGDFNRRFDEPGDEVWADREDGVPASADVTTVTVAVPIGSHENESTQFIDPIVLDAGDRMART